MQRCRHLVGKLKMAAMPPQSKACFFMVATILTLSNPILQTKGNQCFLKKLMIRLTAQDYVGSNILNEVALYQEW